MFGKKKVWTDIGGGLERAKITGGWLIKMDKTTGLSFSQGAQGRAAMVFIPDAAHENPPELL